MAEEIPQPYSLVCSGCYTPCSGADAHVVPRWNPERRMVLTTYRCGNCWLEALTELRTAVTAGDAAVWSSFWEFLIRHGHGKDSDALRAAPFEEQRTLLLRVVDGVGAGTIVFEPEPERSPREGLRRRFVVRVHSADEVHRPTHPQRSCPMSISASLIPEFEQEMTTTRRLLERVPSDKAQWKPHPKSFALGHLAQLVSWMPGWIANTLRENELNLTDAPGYSFESTATLLAGFDKNVREAREALTASKDSDYGVPWSLKRGGMALWTAPKGVVVRTHISHLSHHRGQLTVYLRLLDVPIPSIYGPTADERM